MCEICINFAHRQKLPKTKTSKNINFHSLTCPVSFEAWPWTAFKCKCKWGNNDNNSGDIWSLFFLVAILVEVLRPFLLRSILHINHFSFSSCKDCNPEMSRNLHLSAAKSERAALRLNLHLVENGKNRKQTFHLSRVNLQSSSNSIINSISALWLRAPM